MPDLRHAHLLAAATTRFGRHEGRSALDLMAEAANAALAQSGLRRADIDGVLCGYATTFPHLMLATLLSEKLGLDPHYAHGMQMGGATGAAMVMLARELVRAGRCRRVLVVAGENRLTGQAVDASIQTLAQVGEADTEVPNGASVPAYYALLASAYMHQTGTRREDLAEFAALMRRHAASHPHAHLNEAISVEQVLASRPIATPLHLLDCCPISDGAVALVVSADEGPVRISGAGQAHRHQHLSALRDLFDTGAARALKLAYADADIGQDQVDYLGIYDSFTITLAMLLEELGFAPRGGAAERARRGDFDAAGPLPLNTHGGLLSFGHSGVAGGMAHVAEAWTQLAGRAGSRQVGAPRCALVHADGGVLSAHVSLVLQAQEAR
ncbi:thiolase family protein [Achromobacter sp. 2789STDY5608621]|uniref:thiolase family protein n=1 Tax=Achromobacter sp. 2789STDY5608621 TaxID=1806496 RepID=UPI0006BEEC97|nr:thiolase family protein [Achromobacter sp. 2789STDY5608621]CUJ48133.1 thiolase [Achromobacter sp. 2789STDY5608621]